MWTVECNNNNIIIIAIIMIKYLTLLPVRRYILTVFIKCSPGYVSPVILFHGLQIHVLKNERDVLGNRDIYGSSLSPIFN